MDALDRRGYVVDREDDFTAPTLDRTLWLPHYLPHWSSREASHARYTIHAGELHLRVDADQQPWCPEYDGGVRVSSLQTGSFAGPVGSEVGQHRFRAGMRVREAQSAVALCTPLHGIVEARARVVAHPLAMSALWMIGYEDRPDRSAEICVFEIFGRDVAAGHTLVGMGLRAFADPAIRDDFTRERILIDAREFHDYAVRWDATGVEFFVDDRRVRAAAQSPTYAMQLMLGVYRLPHDVPPDPADGAIELVVERVRVFRPE